MDVGNDVVVDASGMGRLIGTDASVPVVATYGSHPITERFNFVTAFPLARSVTPVMGGVNGRTAQPFAQTSAQSWAEADIKDLLATGKVSLDETRGDKKGPITIAAAVSAASTAPARAGPQRTRWIPRRRNRKRGWRSSAIRTSRPTPASAFRAIATCS